MEIDLERIGNKIRTARLDNKLVQAEVYKPLGISQSHYSRIENGEADITVTMLYKIASVLDVPPLSLLDGNIIHQITDKECALLTKFIKFLEIEGNL